MVASVVSFSVPLQINLSMTSRRLGNLDTLLYAVLFRHSHHRPVIKIIIEI